MNISQEEITEFRLFQEKRAKAEELKKKREERKKKEEEEKKILAEEITKRNETEEKKRNETEDKKRKETEEKIRKEEEKKRNESHDMSDCRIISTDKRKSSSANEEVPKKRSALDLTTEDLFFPSYKTDSDESASNTPVQHPRPFIHVQMPGRISTMPAPVHGYHPKKASTPKPPPTAAAGSSRMASIVTLPKEEKTEKEEKPLMSNIASDHSLVNALTLLTTAQIEVAAALREFSQGLVNVSRAIDRAVPLTFPPRRDDHRFNREDRREERRSRDERH